MKFDDEYSLHLLYELAGKPPYPRLPSFVVPQAKFQPDFPQPPKKPFVPDPILTLKNNWCQETGSNRPHKDFQSSALPTELSWPKK